MAYATIRFRNEFNGHIRQAPVGYSWTTLLFGPFPALSRSDWKWGFYITIWALLTFALSNFYFAHRYNRDYAKMLMDNGFEIFEISDEDLAKIERRNPD